jgi:copper chaperone CopZ
MRQLCVIALTLFVVRGLWAGEAESGKATGLHICCNQCEKVVKGILDKVEGVSDVECDRKNKTVTFKLKDGKGADKVLQALSKGGFCCTVTVGGKSIAEGPADSKDKADEVTVKGVHACCKQCKEAIEKLFPDAKITLTGKGPQKDLTISGKDLVVSDVLKTLNKAGFTGTGSSTK